MILIAISSGPFSEQAFSAKCSWLVQVGPVTRKGDGFQEVAQVVRHKKKIDNLILDSLFSIVVELKLIKTTSMRLNEGNIAYLGSGLKIKPTVNQYRRPEKIITADNFRILVLALRVNTTTKIRTANAVKARRAKNIWVERKFGVILVESLEICPHHGMKADPTTRSK